LSLVIKPFFPPNRQGITADAIVILCNLILVPLLAGRVERLFTAFFSNDQSSLAVLPPIMMFILAGRLVGLYLKRFGLQSRLADAEDGGFPILFFVFSFPLLVLTAAFTAVGFSAWATDGTSSAGSGTIQYVGTFVLIILACIEAYLLYRLGVPLNAHELEMRDRGVWMYTWLGELTADFGLFAYMIIWQVFYHQVAEMLTTRPDGAPMPLDMKLVSIFFMAICFMLFYLAPRAVFLIEDRKYRGTWLMIGLVFLSSLTGLF
jgi:hypothetical protein